MVAQAMFKVDLWDSILPPKHCLLMGLSSPILYFIRDLSDFFEEMFSKFGQKSDITHNPQ